MTQSLFPEERRLGLLTDLYELTMAAGYHVQGLGNQRATFELWVRRLPACRNYLVAAGLEQIVHYLQHLRFAAEQIDYLQGLPVFRQVPASWFDMLAELRFDGDLWAVPEGTVVFAGEPLLRVTAPLMVAQIIETYLLTSITVQTLVASKAARTVTAARRAEGREPPEDAAAQPSCSVIDFGSRRAHGPQAGLLAARAAYVGGCAGTSNVEAGRLLGIPVVGTQAHAWIMAFGDEIEAFRRFGQTFPQGTLLIDTYDTLQGARNALASGAPLQAVRLDSGDLLTLSKQVRGILDEAGRRDVHIVASGDLNEYKVRDLLAAGAPIDVFGVGTELVTSRDEPTLNTVYKLVEQHTAAGAVGRFKRSAGKATYPYAKQVYRQSGPDGKFAGDLVVREGEPADGAPLLARVLEEGRLAEPLPVLKDIQQRCFEQLKRLPVELLRCETAPAYPVRVSDSLQRAAGHGS